jgi:hypothetical protein
MTHIEFHTGKPPHDGWWYCYRDGGGVLESPNRPEHLSFRYGWRFYSDGAYSQAVKDFESIHEGVGYERATRKDNITDQSSICWSTRYPENARVPRLDPTGLSQEEIDGFYTYAASAQEQYLDGLTVYHTDLNGMWKRFTGDIVLGHPRRIWCLVDLASLSAVSLKNFKAHLI